MKIRAAQLHYPILERTLSPEHYFSQVKEQYSRFKQEDLLEMVSRLSIFVYQIKTAKGKIYNGIATAVSMREYTAGNIKGHEATLTAKELQQLELLEERRAQVKPVLLTYPKVSAIEQWIVAIQQSHELFFELEYKTQTHRIWRVDGTDAIAAIEQLFDLNVPTVYIADGHHRTAVMSRWAAKQQTESFLYATLFSSDQIEILPFNRVVEGVAKRSFDGFMKEMKKLCDIRRIKKPFLHPPKHCLQMYIRKQWYALIWKPKILATCIHPIEQLDPYLLDQRILKAVMQIIDIRNSDKVKYIGGLQDSVRRIKDFVDKDEDRIGFYVPAIRIDDFLQVVDAGALLPPKSTWFEPRMLNGLLVQDLYDGN
ncbi:MAG: DUF1015 family protein [Bacteroidota bacterium]